MTFSKTSLHETSPTDNLLILIKKIIHALTEYAKTRPQEFLELKIKKPYKTFYFNTFLKPDSCSNQVKEWLSGITSF